MRTVQQGQTRTHGTCMPARDSGMCVGEAMAPLPGTPSPQPCPACQDGILEGGPRDRVWTTGPHPSCKAVTPTGGTHRRKKRVKVRAIGRFAESATPTFLTGQPIFFELRFRF